MRLGHAVSALAAVTLATAILCSGLGRAAEPKTCAPPRGPGDTLVHSRDLRVVNITCSVGRAIALACTRFTYGHSGICSAAGYSWRCTSSKPPGSESEQRCVAGRRAMSILWLD
jgi:hypothetical protein